MPKKKTTVVQQSRPKGKQARQAALTDLKAANTLTKVKAALVALLE